MGHSGLFFFIFVFSQQLTVKKINADDEIRTGCGSDLSAHCATTTSKSIISENNVVFKSSMTEEG